jgi:hypothetical protein
MKTSERLQLHTGRRTPSTIAEPPPERKEFLHNQGDTKKKIMLKAMHLATS